MKTRRGKIVELICRQDCPAKCARFLAAEIDFDNPAEGCPTLWTGQWHALGPAALSAPQTALIHSPPAPLSDWGPRAWRWLHTEAFASRLSQERILGEFMPKILCVKCLPEVARLQKEIPFRKDDQGNWSVDWHNAVNAKLAAKGDQTKRQWTLEEARAIWSPVPSV